MKYRGEKDSDFYALVWNPETKRIEEHSVGTTRFGGMTTANFAVAGTIRVGISAVDRGAVLTDLEDVRDALDMPDGAGELLGFAADGRYRDHEALANADDFNRRHGHAGDREPVMGRLRDDAGVATILDLAGLVTRALMTIFVAVMSIVLWNAGMMAALRRYGEIGVRLAIGESHGHLYRSLLAESALVGVAGSVLGKDRVEAEEELPLRHRHQSLHHAVGLGFQGDGGGEEDRRGGEG